MFLTYVGVVLGLILAIWGLFHQLIVGAAATMFRDISESEARVFVMSWVAQGAFMSFAGVLTALMLAFYEPHSPPVVTVCGLTGVALLLLSAHVFVTGFRTHLKPVRIGAVLELVHAIYMIFLAVAGSTFLD